MSSMDANAERGERVLAESRAMRAAAYNAQYAANRAQHAALKKLHADSLASIDALARASANPQAAKVTAPQRANRDDDEPMPDQWLQ